MNQQEAIAAAKSTPCNVETYCTLDIRKYIGGTIIFPDGSFAHIVDGEGGPAGHDFWVWVSYQKPTGELVKKHTIEHYEGRLYPNGTWASTNREGCVFVPKHR